MLEFLYKPFLPANNNQEGRYTLRGLLEWMGRGEGGWLLEYDRRTLKMENYVDFGD